MKETQAGSHDFVVEITAADDARLAAYKNIREKDLVGRQQRFIAEGKVVLNVLFQNLRALIRNRFLFSKTV